MAELSHRALRELIESFGGCDEYFTEMISAGPLLGGGPFEAYYIDAGPCPGRVVYQLVGARSDQLRAAAAFLDKRDCAGIDINMGCSAPAITRTGAGVRWMASADRAAALMEQIRRVVTRRLSVKLRIGPEDDFDSLARFCRRLEEAGTDRITLHPRTGREKFKRSARWDYVGRLRRELGIPVAGNGDIADAAGLIRRGKDCDAVMAGRLAVRAPWVFAQARALEEGRPALPDIDLEETALRFLDLLGRYQPPEFRLSRARRFFAYFCDNLQWAHHVKTLLNREGDLAGIAAVWSGYFREHPEERVLRLFSTP
ncbi:MAG: tRNA-dihydrouridine synthase family protein [Treponema sp.]|jgi:tRNA-dihydrouridine synthase|nr:tRNA-dihydrouridine synthase family protein [Treponema sp.]